MAAFTVQNGSCVLVPGDGAYYIWTANNDYETGYTCGICETYIHHGELCVPNTNRYGSICLNCFCQKVAR